MAIENVIFETKDNELIRQRNVQKMHIPNSQQD